MPYLNVFDDISFRVDNGTVTLFGAVTRPTLKSDAEHVVKLGKLGRFFLKFFFHD